MNSIHHSMHGASMHGAMAGWLALACAGSVCAQSGSSAAAARETIRAAAPAAENPSAPGGNLLREIEDPSTGDLWLLVRDPGRPAGPARLVLARQRAGSPGRKNDDQAQAGSGGELPVIHAGDAVVVEEHTPVVDARLEAVALGPAVKGAYFRARLAIGGKVVRVEAVSSNRAVFGPRSEVKP